MSRFTRGDCVVDQHGERFIVVDDARRCEMTQKWCYTLVPDSKFSVSRREDELAFCPEPTNEAVPALTANPEMATTFIEAVKALTKK